MEVDSAVEFEVNFVYLDMKYREVIFYKKGTFLMEVNLIWNNYTLSEFHAPYRVNTTCAHTSLYWLELCLSVESVKSKAFSISESTKKLE